MSCETEEDPEDLKQASDRLTNHILGKADRAARLFHPHRHVSPGEARTESADDDFGLTDARQATAWLDEEHAWLRAVAEHWFANGRPKDAGLLVHLIAKFLERRNRWKESVVLHQQALQVWREQRNQINEAHALIDIAAAQWRLGSFEAAVASASRAMGIWSDLGDTGGQADALLQLGRVNAIQHKHAEAIADFEECLALHLERGDRHGLAVTLQHLGIALFESSRHQAGIERTLQALDIAREISEENIETYCINNLGEFYSRVGDYASAEPYFQQALLKVQEHGERHSIAVVALNLGDCHTRLARPEVALPLLDRALDLFQRGDNEHGVMLVLIAQARAHLGLHRSRSARELLDRAIISAERSKDSRAVANICLINGDIYTAAKDEHSATLAYGQALRYAREVDARLLQAVAVHRLGDSAERRGDTSAARSYWLDAIRLYGDAHASEISTLWDRMTQEDAA
jgi:tetratricopeptide (TPR) repeat protein